MDLTSAAAWVGAATGVLSFGWHRLVSVARLPAAVSGAGERVSAGVNQRSERAEPLGG